jgi:predicted RNase H-like HicB family nuclease
MELPILIEPLRDRPGYTARVGSPFDVAAEGATPEEARQHLAAALQQRLQPGALVGSIRLPISPAQVSHGGWLPDDELTQEWLQHVQQFRQECDEADRRRLADDPGDEKAAS